MQEFLEAIVLGMVQGVLEWLPISSEGINSLIMVNLFGKTFAEAAVYSIWLHAGTLLAAVIYFREEVLKLLKNLPLYVKSPKKDTDENRLTTFLIVSTALTGIVGLPILLLGVERANVSGASATAFIGLLLILTGLLQKYSRRHSLKRSVTLEDSALVGSLQAFSVLPGISRSGITMSGLLLRKYEAHDALKLSFLMSIPAVLIAEVGLALLGKIIINAYSLLAVTISFVFGLLTIGILMEIAGRVNFGNFCIFLGLLSFAAVLV
jgi:undecaprenyl-diphosphatase